MCCTHRLPRSTPFPYTTLFRSMSDLSRAPRAKQNPIGVPMKKRVLCVVAAMAVTGVVGCGTDEEAERREAEAARKAQQQDRKSTRLNSSHLVISYAVFGLKKKK